MELVTLGLRLKDAVNNLSTTLGQHFAKQQELAEAQLEQHRVKNELLLQQLLYQGRLSGLKFDEGTGTYSALEGSDDEMEEVQVDGEILQ